MVRSDAALFQHTAAEVERRFPRTDTAAQVRYISATAQDRAADEIAALQKLIAEYPPRKFKSGEEAANRLFYLEDASDPGAAQKLAHACLAQLSKEQHWKAVAAYADAMADATRQLAAGRSADALETLKAIKTDDLPLGADRLEVLHAQALEASGDAAGAYRLLEQAFATKPSDITGAALYRTGERMGKSRAEVDKQIETIRAGAAKTPLSFSLQAFTGGAISLSDYKGRIVVLDFWFPNCGPCRSSFPFVRKLIDKYKDNRDVVFLAINAIAGQEPFVIPLLRSEQIHWLPLKGNIEWCNDVYGVSTFPTTFLIGRDNRIYFKPRIRSSDSERSAEVAIDALLAMH